MNTPILKDRWSMMQSDFENYPVWVRVIDFDQDQAWFPHVTEQTYRPWDGALPFEPRFQFTFALVRATFRLSSGKSFPGFINPVREDWDEPLPPRRMKDGMLTKPFRWSSRCGGSPLSILALHSPIIFIGQRGHDFHLKRDMGVRKRHIVEFYNAVRERPENVFPIQFSSSPEHFRGIVSGQLEGFYSFTPDKPCVIDTGRGYLLESR